MDKADWESAPDWADRYIFSKLSGKSYFSDGKNIFTSVGKEVLVHSGTSLIEMRPDEWKEGEKRMEQIVQNGNDGAVYGELEVGQVGREARLTGIDKTLSERGGRYGEFPDNGRVAQELKRVMKSGRNADILRDFQREALEVIASKIARIVNGDPDYIDNWHDIIGYAKLVEIELEQEKGE
jgi:hypothetical protein